MWKWNVGDRVRWYCRRYPDHPDAMKEATVVERATGFFHYRLRFDDDDQVMLCMEDEVLSADNEALN